MICYWRLRCMRSFISNFVFYAWVSMEFEHDMFEIDSLLGIIKVHTAGFNGLHICCEHFLNKPE